MKLICLCAPFLLSALSASAQEPNKNDNTIEVRGVSFVQVKSALVDSGYFIDQSDPDVGTIVTKEHSADNRRMFGKPTDAYHLIMSVRVKDSVAVFQGEYNFNKAKNNALTGARIDKSDWHPLEYKPSGMSVDHVVWAYMDKMARAFGTPVSYSKR
jgi:hypothetical protein